MASSTPKIAVWSVWYGVWRDWRAVEENDEYGAKIRIFGSKILYDYPMFIRLTINVSGSPPSFLRQIIPLQFAEARISRCRF